LQPIRDAAAPVGPRSHPTDTPGGAPAMAKDLSRQPARFMARRRDKAALPALDNP